MIPLLASAPALPLGKAGKFVAAAYIVVFVIVLVYVGIMAVRARRVERDLAQLRREVDAARQTSVAPGEKPAPSEKPAPTEDPERSGSRL